MNKVAIHGIITILPASSHACKLRAIPKTVSQAVMRNMYMLKRIMNRNRLWMHHDPMPIPKACLRRSDMQNIDVIPNKRRRVTAEVILNELVPVGEEIDQLPRAARPLRPSLRHLALGASTTRSIVWIQVVDKVGIIAVNTLAGIVGKHTVEDLQQVRAVEGTQDGRAVVIAGEIRPDGNVRLRGGDVLEEDTAGEGEDEITKDCGETLEAGVDLVKQTGAEG